MPGESDPSARADKRLAPPRRCRSSTATLSSPAGDIVVLRLAGEVDLTTFTVLDAALEDVLDRRPDHLIIDLTELLFCSARGLTAIARSARAAAAAGTSCSMSAASPMIARLWPHFWHDGDAPHIHRTTAAAVLSAIALQADLWRPAPIADAARPYPVANEHDLDSWPLAIREGVDDTPRTGPDSTLRERLHADDAAALRQALHHHRSRIYRSALQALGAGAATHPQAPDLDTQLRIALAKFTATGRPQQRRGHPVRAVVPGPPATS